MLAISSTIISIPNQPELPLNNNSRIIVRKAAPADRSTIIALLDQDDYCDRSDSAEQLVNTYLKGNRSSCFGWTSRCKTLVAEDNNKICAVLLYTIVHDRFIPCCFDNGTGPIIQVLEMSQEVGTNEKKYISALMNVLQEEAEEYDWLQVSLADHQGRAAAALLRKHGHFDDSKNK